MTMVVNVIGLLLIAALTSCSSMRIDSDYDTSANFSALKTYSWMARQPQSREDPRVDSTLLESRVRAAVDRELSFKGYAKVPSEEADFLIAYHVTREGRMQLHTMGGPGWGWGGTTTHVEKYEEGTLILDVIAPDGKMLLWRGTATARIDESAGAEKREKRINEAVRRMLQRFPPRLT